MSSTRFLWTPVPFLFFVLTSCSDYQSSTDRHADRMKTSRASYGGHLAQMVDNAVLRDMSMSEIHFVPHSKKVSGTGVSRLDRIARYLAVYGGTVRYDARESDKILVQDRLEEVREYLSVAGCDMSQVKVAVMLPGGGGRPAAEVVDSFGQDPELGDAGSILSGASQGGS